MDREGALRTFLFTDIVGSTRLWQRHPNEMGAALEAHDQIIRAVVSTAGGVCFAGGGDGFGAVFDDPAGAARAALDAQRRLVGLAVGGDEISVRMGIHTGPAQERDGDFFGIAVNRAARIAAAAHGGQVLASATTAGHLADTALVPLGSYRLADLLEPVDLVQVGGGSFPPVRALDPDRHNLPIRFTSLIGRDDLIDRVTDELAAGRLVTLVGPGGIGKTTVALETAARLVPTVDRGVWFVPLDDLAAGSPIEPAVAGALGMAPVEGWRRTAAGRDQLVVLDNAEHVIDQTADTAATLLRSGSAIRLLVTSREPLGVPGETVVEVPPLPADETADLFVDRAQTGPSDEAIVEDLVGRLDGMPLVAELVAAHATRLPLTDLLRSLEDHGVGSLTTRGTAPRHRSATAAVAWSYDLLNPDEQNTFARLGVVDGDFTIRQAAELTGATTATIQGLIEKSLIHRAGDRYRFLEPVKEYAVARLDERADADAARRRLVELIANTAVDLDDRFGPREYAEWAAHFDWSAGDLAGAFGWVADAGDLELAARLMRGVPAAIVVTIPNWHDWVPILDSIEPIVDRWSLEPARWRWGLFRFAYLEDMVWRELEARARVTALRALPDVANDPEFDAACAIVQLKSTHGNPLPIEEIEALAEEVRARNERFKWWERGAVDWLLGHHYLRLGRFDQARSAFTRALDDPGLKDQVRWTVIGELAETEREAGNPERSLEILDSIDPDDPEHARELTNEKAHTYIALGQPEEAWQCLEPLIEYDLAQTQPTTVSFCAAADYFRALGDHRTAIWFMAKMLEGRLPTAPVHHNVIAEAKAHLGDAFDVEWQRGQQSDIYTLYGLLTEGP